MRNKDPLLITLLFNDCINCRDLKKLSELMTEDHRLICNGSVDTEDKQSSKIAWEKFFKLYPDYRNHFNKIVLKNNLVSIAGFSTCSEKILDGPALWSARIEKNLVSEWQVYEDNEYNRINLNLI